MKLSEIDDCSICPLKDEGLVVGFVMVENQLNLRVQVGIAMKKLKTILNQCTPVSQKEKNTKIAYEKKEKRNGVKMKLPNGNGDIWKFIVAQKNVRLSR